LGAELARLKSETVPVRFRVCGLPGALSLIVKAPLKVPAEGGMKETLTMQLELAGTTGWQLFVCAKVPVTWMLLICNGMEPLLESVTL